MRLDYRQAEAQDTKAHHSRRSVARTAQTKALWPVMARPTISVFISRVPS